MGNWFDNDIFKIKNNDVKNKHLNWETPTLEDLQNECWQQVITYGTLNDIGKFCYDMSVYLEELKNYKNLGLDSEQIQYLLDCLNFNGNYKKLINELNQIKELVWKYEELNK